MKIALAQLNYHIGNFDANVSKMLAAIEDAKSQSADLIVFSELAVCGYPPRDFLQFEDFTKSCEAAVTKIASAAKGIAVIVGAPSVNPKIEGKNLFNSAFFLEEGKIKSVHSKALLPTYDVFDEYRYFEPKAKFEVAHLNGKKIAITICEDLWDVGDDKLYTVEPMDSLSEQGPEIMINIAASPFSYKHFERRKKVLEQNVHKYNLPLVYVNHVGAQTELIFDGGSMAINAKGELCELLPFFEEGIRIIDTPQLHPKGTAPSPDKLARIYNALVLGVRDYFSKLNFKTAIVGLSGGIDSAVTLAIVCEALGAKNVLAVLMPSQFSSDHSVEDAVDMVELLGCRHETIRIHEAYETLRESMPESFQNTQFGLAEENIQARLRAVIVMALANKEGHILLNTSNKSEAAVGYGTLYGDMSGGLSVLGDVYKTEVYALADYINSLQYVIPQNIIDKEPSAELRPDQKDSDSLPDYEILDTILFHYIEESMGPDEILAAGFEKQLVDRVLKLVNSNEFKRAQAPPVLRVSDKAFGMGRRMPIVGKYLS